MYETLRNNNVENQNKIVLLVSFLKRTISNRKVERLGHMHQEILTNVNFYIFASVIFNKQLQNSSNPLSFLPDLISPLFTLGRCDQEVEDPSPLALSLWCWYP